MPHRLPDVSIKFPKLPSVDGENVVFRLIKAHLFSKKHHWKFWAFLVPEFEGYYMILL
jgi:hypothetical protein